MAVKAAYDTLFDHAKRQGYDSTVLPFDDSIPPARATLLQQQQQQQSSDNTSSLQLYKDEDFYDTFGPVFLRNLRFDARLRPDLGNNSNSSSSNGSSSKSSGSFNKKNNNGGSTKPKEPPVLGDAATGLDQVHTFYEYWIHFESWRDFSAQAADELKVGEHELENAESRFEKRWIQKEIDKRARILKRAEMARVQQLVERAMECDPRLRRERQEQVQAKERAAAERARLKENEALEAAAAAERRAAEEEELKAQRALEKVQRDKEKKLFRKARQTLRRMTSSSFEGGHGECEPSAEQQLWNDAYDMNQDVEFLCGTLSLDELNQLNEDYETGGLQLVHQHIMEKKQRNNAQQQNGSSNINHNAIGEQRQQHPQTAAAASATEQQQQQQQAPTSSSKDSKAPWTATELSALAKAVKKYPAGGASRWEAISLLVNNLCKQDNPRTREECIEKYNQIARKATVANGSSAISKAAAAAAVAESEIAAAATSTAAATTTSTAAAAATTTNGHGNNCNDAAPLTAADMTADVVWTPEQDQLLQDALSKYPASMDKNDRWTAIATAVPGKTKKACVNRFKAIREALLKNKK